MVAFLIAVEFITDEFAEGVDELVINGIVAGGSALLARHDVSVKQSLQVLGHVRLIHAEFIDKFTHILRTFAQALEQLKSSGICKGAKELGDDLKRGAIGGWRAFTG